MCSSTVPSSLICGVTSSATPEKNGVSSTLSDVVVEVPVVVSLLTPVTKNSSEPALMTAFWLCSVETRGLDSTRVRPCASSNWMKALKSVESNANVNAPATASTSWPTTGMPGVTGCCCPGGVERIRVEAAIGGAR